MKKTFARIFVLAALFACLSAPALSVKAEAEKLETEATGYTAATDVEYVRSGSYVLNWGARGEDCVFLSEYAEGFYTGEYRYETLSRNEGGSSQTDAPNSALYSALRDMMKAKHTKITNYKETRYMYCYTDCERSDSAHISSFYSGKTLSGTWDFGSTWNREHTWPNSKGLGGSDEDDIMMLRPTSVSENSSRGNKAYGESGGYYDPGESVRGDCARIVLYTYVRWGNTKYMWGASGVMESLDVLLKWMEEDPVDTWEMGRNDAVQAITGTRNVFVDYPEYAWLLFGEELPEEMTTPSGVELEEEENDPDSSVQEPPFESSVSASSDGESFEGSEQEESASASDDPSSDIFAKLLSGCNASIVAPFTGVGLLTVGCAMFFKKKKGL